MTDAKCPWCGAVEVDRCSDGSRYYACGTHNEPSRQVINGTFFETPCWVRSDHCKVRADLAQHKQRLMDQSAKLAAAEAELRRLRQVIEAAPDHFSVCVLDGQEYWYKTRDAAENVSHVFQGRRIVHSKLVPLDELEATND